jgi:hypothetical protein
MPASRSQFSVVSWEFVVVSCPELKAGSWKLVALFGNSASPVKNKMSVKNAT